MSLNNSRKAPLPPREEMIMPRPRFWRPGSSSWAEVDATAGGGTAASPRPVGHPRPDVLGPRKDLRSTEPVGTSPTGTADTDDDAEEWRPTENSVSHGRERHFAAAAAAPYLPHRLLRREAAPPLPKQPSLKPTPNSVAAAASFTHGAATATVAATTVGAPADLQRHESGNSLLSWARSRQRRFGAVRAAAATARRSSDSDDDEEDGSYRGYNSDDYEDDYQNEEDDDESIGSLETEDGGVIAIGLPAPAALAGSSPDGRRSSTPPADLPPPRSPEEATQRAVSRAVAETVAEEEHSRKTGEKARLAAALAEGGAAVVVRRSRNAGTHGGGDADDELRQAKQRERESILSHQESSAAAMVSHRTNVPGPQRKVPADQEIKDAIRREMSGVPGTHRSRAIGGGGGTTTPAAYAAQRSRREQSKLLSTPEEEKGLESGPSLAPATALLIPSESTPNRSPPKIAAAAHLEARSRQEQTKLGEAGPSLAPATFSMPAAKAAATTTCQSPVLTSPGAYASASPVGRESLKGDNGPTLAPAADAEAASRPTPLSRAGSEESAATFVGGGWVAQAGIPVLPGAFAVEGIEAAQRRRGSRDFNDLDDAEVGGAGANAQYDAVHDEDELLGLGASLRHSETAPVPTGLSDSSILHVSSSYVVGDAPLIGAIDPFEAELQVVVEGAVIEADDSMGALDAKAFRRLRLVQGSILCLAVAAVGLIIGAILGFRSGSTEEPLGWVQVGGDLHGPSEEPQTYFGQSLAASADGTRIVAAAPGMDQELLLNVGQIAIFDAVPGKNGTDWSETSTIAGDDSSPVAECSLALSLDGRRIVSGHPHLGSGVVLVHEERSESSSTLAWDPIATIQAPEVSNDDDAAAAAAWFGYAVGVSDDSNVVAVGSPMASANGKVNAGALFLYQWENDQWKLWGTSVTGEHENDLLGWSVAIRPSKNGYRIAAGGPSHDAEAGLVRIWDFANGEWGQATTLTGNKPLNRFGEALVLSDDGDTLVVGARGNAFDKGQVFVYRHVDGRWIQETQVFEGEQPAEGYGAALALSPNGNVLAIGAPQNAEFGLDSGKVEVFKRGTDGEWVREGRPIHGNSGEEFGRSVALSLQGKRLVAGGPSATFDGSIAQAGVVRVYDRDE